MHVIVLLHALRITEYDTEFTHVLIRLVSEKNEMFFFLLILLVLSFVLSSRGIVNNFRY